MAFDALPQDLSPPPARGKRRGGGALAKAAGRSAEQAALRRYVKGGAVPLAVNWHAKKMHGGGEIDLVLERDGAVIFVEVKARRTLEEAGHAITRAQMRRVRRAAEGFMCETGRWGGDMQVDVVLCDRFGAMEKIPNVWIE